MINTKVGDEIVCVDDVGTAPNFNLENPDYPAQELVEGRTYKVRWIGMHNDPFYEGRYLGVRVAGVVRPVDPVSGADDKPFAARRFKPVVKTERKETRRATVDS